MQRVISATNARVHFGDLIRRVVEEGQTVIVERDGVPQVVVISVAEFERIRTGAETERWRDALERATRVGARIGERRAGRPLSHPADVILEGREERDAHYPSLR